MRLTNSTKTLISGCILLPGFAMLGCILGLVVHRYDLEPYRAWKNLGSPPAKIKELLVADIDTIYVQTIDGRIFSCYRATQYDQECWNQVDSISQVWVDDPSCPLIDYYVPPEPDGVIDRLINRRCIDSPVLTANEISLYILLTDGTVMQWISDPVGPKRVDQFNKKVFTGCIAGVLVGIIVSLCVFIMPNLTLVKRG